MTGKTNKKRKKKIAIDKKSIVYCRTVLKMVKLPDFVCDIGIQILHQHLLTGLITARITGL